MDRQAEPVVLPLMLSAARALLAVAVLSSFSGCQIIIGVMQIAQGFPKTTCDFTRTTHKKLAEKEKRVVVLVSSTDGARSEVPSLDIDIIAELSRGLRTANIKVVDEHKVANWIDEHDTITKSTDLEPIGELFKADYIILVSFDDFGYHEENSPSLFRGHAAGKVIVAEMVADKSQPARRRPRTASDSDTLEPGQLDAIKPARRAKVIYNKPFTSKYPLNRPVAIDQEGPDTFKARFMQQLSQTLIRLFVDYRPEDEI